MAHGAPPFNALYTFVITAKHLNLTNAAKELFVTQGAVSRQIATLEDYLGFKVFHRHARGLTLTSKGNEILPEIEQAYQQLIRATENAIKPNGEIRLKAPSCSMRWLVPKLLSFQKTYPDIHVALTATNQHGVNFAAEDFDAAVVFVKSHADQPKGNKLFDELLTPVVSSTLGAFTKLEQINQQTFLHPAKDHTDWKLWLKQAGLQDLAMQKNQYFDTMDLAISAAIQGLGITVADLNLVQEDLDMKRLLQPFPIQVKTGASYYLLHKAEADNNPIIQTLVNWIAQN